MPSALERTEKIKMGPLVTTPIGDRYHPLIIGQASATLDNTCPGRFHLAVGKGEAINEANFLSNTWPRWQERIKRLSEAVIIIKRMWESEVHFTHQGKYFMIDKIYLYQTQNQNSNLFCCTGKKGCALCRNLRRSHRNN